MATPQKALMSGLPPRGSISTPRTNKRTEESPASSGAPTKPPSARKQGSSASDNLRGIAINFNTLVDIEAMQSRKAAWGDGRSVIAITPEQKRPQEKRRLADLDDQGVIRPIPLSFEPTSGAHRHGARIEAGDDQFLCAAAAAAAAGDVSSSIDSPDPCSKFHNGPGPISISPVTPGAPTSFVIDNGFERDAFSLIRKTLKQSGASGISSSNSSSSDMPLIYGSNVSVDSPDPCSKFHSGPGPVAVSPLTPVGPSTFSNTNKRSCEDNTASCPLIYGSNVSVDSPDVFSKYNKANAEAQQAERAVLPLPNTTEVRRASVVEKAWRSSMMAEEAENLRSEKWHLSQPVASVSTVSTRKASGTRHISRAPAAVVSPDENAAPDSFFSQTMSPLKPNYDQMIKTIAHAVETCPSPSPSSSSSSSRQARKASPAEFLFKQTMSPFKADYRGKCEEINSPAGARQPSGSTRVVLDFGSPQVEKQSFLPIKPCPPPPRPVAPAVASASSAAPKERPQPAFRRNFTGKDVSNTRASSAASSLNQLDDQENAIAAAPTSTGGSGNLRRGRLLKQTTTTPPSLVLQAEVEAEVQPARPQRAIAVRVSYLQCEYQDGSKTKQAKKKKARLVRFEPLLETIPETFPALFATFPLWLESAISSAYGASLGSVRRITNDGIIVPRTSSSSTEDEQAALIDAIAKHEEETQQQQQLSVRGGGASRLRKLLLEPLAASNSWLSKTDTYGLWLSKQCRPSMQDDPIFHLCFNGDVDGVQSFIKGNSDEDFSELRDSHGNTLLHLAAVSGNLKIVKLCIRLGIDANSSNNFGNCPLHFAEELGNPAVVDALIRRGGADPFVKNALDQAPGERVQD